ncbi:MAG: GNAT family N-acetyltransferase [Lachnospiraceae bacterium]|nr:GNAT family N-acetyltransferase [Lachnospiraceae bacterium]
MSEFKTFVDVKDIDKLNEFYKNGFYASGEMLVMEKTFVDKPEGYVEKFKDEMVEEYDTENLTEYLNANAKGFTKQDPLEDILDQLSNPNSKIYVLRVKGKIAASVTVWDRDEETVSTENIFTVPKFRGKGYATRVLSEALCLARDRGMKKARLTVYANDTPAILMYLKFGYKITKIYQEFMHE